MNNYIYQEPGGKLADLSNKALKKCPEEGVRTSNLILSGLFEIDEINDRWINGFKEKAMQWQSNPAPDNLEFSHGQYIQPFKTESGEGGVDFLIKELKEKHDSNRACWSLLTMKELLNHEQDQSIPSFMLLQAGITDNLQTLILTGYYRALEVSNFLPINMAEMCLIAERIKSKFVSITQLSLTIHAFGAYNDPEFSCLEKVEIDYIDPMAIMLAITNPVDNKEEIVKWVSDKMKLKESRINPRGLINLAQSMNLLNDKGKDKGCPIYPRPLLELLDKVNKQIAEHNKLRLTSSHSSEIGKRYKAIKEGLMKIISLLANGNKGNN
ncbi:hypothetical protein [Pedobacter sp. V48]|uniref:hypothetical protein n=1 Tax=Pedobacter sp. V48 TaxID=509635 RepID=UPI0003E53DE0|nr:hypothetical protein [Pedobacter sp. V48]ETZ22819.1 hypothetical protein N824_21245 [Pedobacter sp. V48]